MPLSGTGFLKDILEDNVTRKPATGRNRLNTLDSSEKGVYANRNEQPKTGKSGRK